MEFQIEARRTLDIQNTRCRGWICHGRETAEITEVEKLHKSEVEKLHKSM